MNELLTHLVPINPFNDKRSIYNLNRFKQFVAGRDVEDLNCGIEAYDDYMDYFFRTYPLSVTEREMNVLASLICWLGTTMGRCYLADVEKLAKTHGLEKAFMYAWAKENRRVSWINHGFTMMEYLVTPYQRHSHDHGLLCRANEYLSVNDLELANYFMAWLANGDGQTYLAMINDAEYNLSVNPIPTYMMGDLVFIKDPHYTHIYVVTRLYPDERHRVEIKTAERGYPVPDECWGFTVDPRDLRRADPIEAKNLKRMID